MNLRRLLLLGLCFLFAGSPTIEAQKKPGEINTPPAKGERYKDTLRVGDPAPDFTLADPNGQSQISLSSFKGKKPVVLIFGSYT
jgi:cytochrome oxidase Cu insertion factor (SCO1/SenC/PrrC family)